MRAERQTRHSWRRASLYRDGLCTSAIIDAELMHAVGFEQLHRCVHKRIESDMQLDGSNLRVVCLEDRSSSRGWGVCISPRHLPTGTACSSSATNAASRELSLSATGASTGLAGRRRGSNARHCARLTATGASCSAKADVPPKLVRLANGSLAASVAVSRTCGSDASDLNMDEAPSIIIMVTWTPAIVSHRVVYGCRRDMFPKLHC
jgi:hypothetical protein